MKKRSSWVNFTLLGLGMFVWLNCGGASESTDTTTTEAPPSTDQASDSCQTDADCVPGDCCHPSSCVAKSAAKSCADMMCTQECKDGTMDCGGGNCVCQDGHCAVKWLKSHTLQGVTPE